MILALILFIVIFSVVFIPVKSAMDIYDIHETKKSTEVIKKHVAELIAEQEKNKKTTSDVSNSESENKKSM